MRSRHSKNVVTFLEESKGDLNAFGGLWAEPMGQGPNLLAPVHPKAAAAIALALLLVVTATNSFHAALTAPLFAAAHILYAKLNRTARQTKIQNYPLCAYHASLFHGLVVCPLITTLIFLDTINRTFDQVLEMTWQDKPKVFMEQAFAAIQGYMLKDGSDVYAPFELGYVLHHIVTIFGCAVCFCLPMGAGLATFNGLQCEIASALFSYRLVYPTIFSRVVYYLSMTTSNILGLYLAFVLGGYPISFKLRFAYIAAAVMLVTLRSAAVFMDVSDLIWARATSPITSTNEHTEVVKGSSPNKIRSPSSKVDERRTPTRKRSYPPGLGLTPKMRQGLSSESVQVKSKSRVRESNVSPGPRQRRRGIIARADLSPPPRQTTSSKKSTSRVAVAKLSPAKDVQRVSASPAKARQRADVSPARHRRSPRLKWTRVKSRGS